MTHLKKLKEYVRRVLEGLSNRVEKMFDLVWDDFDMNPEECFTVEDLTNIYEGDRFVNTRKKEKKKKNAH